MTRSSNARLAGFGYLSNIVVGILNEVLMHRATRVDGTAATLARIGDHLMELLEAGTISPLAMAREIVVEQSRADRNRATASSPGTGTLRSRRHGRNIFRPHRSVDACT
jgi:hypothetical protein